MLKINIGDIINFKGNTHYESTDIKEGKSCKSGLARVDMVKEGTLNPYHIIAEPNQGSDVYGWVRTNDIEEVPLDKQVDISIDKLFNLRVINSPDYWKEFVKTKEVLGLDYLFIKASRFISSKKEGNSYSPYEAIVRLTNIGVITLPDYWNHMSANYTNVGYLISAMGNSLDDNIDSMDTVVKENINKRDREAELRNKVVETAKAYLGYNEWDGSHREIIDGYNAVKPLPSTYKMKYTDSWCATFVSFIAIKCGIADTLIPRECSCERQIELFKNLGTWHEDENYMPKPGDIIYYNWDDGWNYATNDNTLWADHVGIVVETGNGNNKSDLGTNEILVIEGNKNDCVEYRTVVKNGRFIRGYGLPDYKNF